MGAPRPHYLTLDEGQVRIWRSGEGPDVAVLHGLILGAEATAARMARALPRRCVTVFELPGIGGSSAAGHGARGTAALLDDAAALCVAADAPLVACDLAGAVAMHMRLRPKLWADAAAAKAWAARNWRPPDLTPRQDGTHLIALWSHVRDAHMFEPAAPTLPAQVGAPLPTVKELDLTVTAAAVDPVAFARLWTACLDEMADLNGEQLREVGRGDDEALARVLSGPLGRPLSPTAPAPTRARTGGLWNQYVETPRGRMHLRRSGQEGRPLLVIPTGGGSSAQFAPVVEGLAKGRQVFAVDYFGNGLSEKLERDVAIGDLADDMAALIDALGFAAVDVWGSHTGALVGLELAIRRPDLVSRAVLEGPVFISPGFQSDLLAQYFPPIRPDPWGQHLQLVWNWRRDMFLYWPWYRVERAAARRLGLPSAEQLNLYALGILESGPTYDRAYRAAFAYDTRARMPLLRRPALVCAGPNDMLIDGLKEAAALNVPTVEVRVTPTTVWWPNPEPQASAATFALYEDFLGRKA